jgi:hypothetical protein
VRYLPNIIGTGTIVVSVTAVRYSFCLIVLGAFLLAILAMGVVAVAAFSKRSAPMARLRSLVREFRSEGGRASRRWHSTSGS